MERQKVIRKSCPFIDVDENIRWKIWSGYGSVKKSYWQWRRNKGWEDRFFVWMLKAIYPFVLKTMSIVGNMLLNMLDLGIDWVSINGKKLKDAVFPRKEGTKMRVIMTWLTSWMDWSSDTTCTWAQRPHLYWISTSLKSASVDGCVYGARLVRASLKTIESSNPWKAFAFCSRQHGSDGCLHLVHAYIQGCTHGND